jgi:hypothetical protein
VEREGERIEQKALNVSLSTVSLSFGQMEGLLLLAAAEFLS